MLRDDSTLLPIDERIVNSIIIEFFGMITCNILIQIYSAILMKKRVKFCRSGGGWILQDRAHEAAEWALMSTG